MIWFARLGFFGTVTGALILLHLEHYLMEGNEMYLFMGLLFSAITVWFIGVCMSIRYCFSTATGYLVSLRTIGVASFLWPVWPKPKA